MSVEEMRAQYEEIKADLARGRAAAERDEGIRRLTALARGRPSRSPDSGAEALQMEIEDLIQDIRRHSIHT